MGTNLDLYRWNIVSQENTKHFDGLGRGPVWFSDNPAAQCVLKRDMLCNFWIVIAEIDYQATNAIHNWFIFGIFYRNQSTLIVCQL